MGKFDIMQTSFLGGELSPRALGRLDLEIYKAGASTIENFVVYPHGGASRRGGTKFVYAAKYNNKDTILVNFSYQGLYYYVFEITHEVIRFFKDQAILGAPYEVATTYDESEIKELRLATDGETLFIFHKNHKPARLDRTTDTNWTLSDVSYISFNQVPVAAGTTYAIGETLTITQAGGSGGTVKVVAVDSAGGVTRVETVTQGTGYKIAAALATVTDGDGDDACTIECTSDTHPPEWGASNYPTLGWFFEQRFMLAATPDEPNGVWGSQSTDYFNFELGEGLDNEGIKVICKQADSFLWVVAGDIIHLGASNAEFLLISNSSDDALTPSNVRPLRTTKYGSASLPAAEIDSNAVFIQRGTRKVRRLQYDLQSSKYIAREISTLSEHITESGIEDIAFTNEPDSFIWMKRVDGVLACQTYDPDNRIYAWHRHVLAGTDMVVHAITASNGKTAGRDELWMVVERTINEATVRTIEFLTQGLLPEDDQEDAFFVDCGVTATGSDLTEVTTLSHLEGETVSILADGAVQPDAVVASGTVAIDPPADTVHVGLPYTSTLDTLPVEGGIMYGSSQGKIKQINTIVLRLDRSLGFWVGPPGGDLDQYFFGPTDSMGDAIPLFTGDTEDMPFPGNPDRQSLVRIQQSAPLPLTILGIMLSGHTE